MKEEKPKQAAKRNRSTAPIKLTFNGALLHGLEDAAKLSGLSHREIRKELAGVLRARVEGIIRSNTITPHTIASQILRDRAAKLATVKVAAEESAD